MSRNTPLVFEVFWSRNAPQLLTPFIYLAVVSVKLILFRPEALRWAGWLLTLELAGAALLFAVSDYYRPRAANWLAFVKGGIATVGLVALL